MSTLKVIVEFRRWLFPVLLRCPCFISLVKVLDGTKCQKYIYIRYETLRLRYVSYVVILSSRLLNYFSLMTRDTTTLNVCLWRL